MPALLMIEHFVSVMDVLIPLAEPRYLAEPRRDHEARKLSKNWNYPALSDLS
jgi:hypothetical protein